MIEKILFYWFIILLLSVIICIIDEITYHLFHIGIITLDRKRSKSKITNVITNPKIKRGLNNARI